MSMLRHQTAIVEAQTTWYNGALVNNDDRRPSRPLPKKLNVARMAAAQICAAAIIAANIVVCFVIRLLITTRLGVGNDD